jgi:hypothetical protein
MYTISGLMAVNLYFCLNFISHCIARCATGLPDIENMGIPHEIALLYSIEDEITREKQNKKPVLEPWGKNIIVGEG